MTDYPDKIKRVMDVLNETTLVMTIAIAVLRLEPDAEWLAELFRREGIEIIEVAAL